MGYVDDRSKSENSAPNVDCVLEIREPVAPYYSGGGGSAVAEPDEAGLDGEFNPNCDWDDGGGDEPMTAKRAAAIRQDPAFIVWEQEVIRKLLEGRAETLAGNTRPFNEAVDEILRDIENGTI